MRFEGFGAGNATEAAPPVSLSLLVASHHGQVGSDAILWRSTLVARAEDVLPSAWARVELALPLPREVELQDTSLLRVEKDEAGEILALEISPEAWGPLREVREEQVRSLSLSLRQPLRAREGSLRLAVPLVAGQAIERVSLEDAEGIRFLPHPSSGIERYIGYFSTPGIDWKERHRCDRLVDQKTRDGNGGPIYLQMDTLFLKENGLVGDLSTGSQRTQWVALAVGAAFVLVILLLGLGYRWLSRQARIEQAEAFLDAEWKDLKPQGATPPEAPSTRSPAA